MHEVLKELFVFAVPCAPILLIFTRLIGPLTVEFSPGELFSQSQLLRFIGP